MKLISNFVILVLVIGILFLGITVVKNYIHLNFPALESDIQNYLPLSLNQNGTTKIKTTPKPTPIPLKPDDGAKGTYSVAQGKHEGPNITKVIFDPLDAQRGKTLTITVNAESQNPIDSLTANIQEDNGSQEISFTLSNGNQANGTWTGSINLTDSVLYKYILSITAVSGSKSSTVIVAPRS